MCCTKTDISSVWATYGRRVLPPLGPQARSPLHLCSPSMQGDTSGAGLTSAPPILAGMSHERCPENGSDLVWHDLGRSHSIRKNISVRSSEGVGTERYICPPDMPMPLANSSLKACHRPFISIFALSSTRIVASLLLVR